MQERCVTWSIFCPPSNPASCFRFVQSIRLTLLCKSVDSQFASLVTVVAQHSSVVKKSQQALPRSWTRTRGSSTFWVTHPSSTESSAACSRIKQKHQVKFVLTKLFRIVVCYFKYRKMSLDMSKLWVFFGNRLFEHLPSPNFPPRWFFKTPHSILKALQSV